MVEPFSMIHIIGTLIVFFIIGVFWKELGKQEESIIASIFVALFIGLLWPIIGIIIAGLITIILPLVTVWYLGYKIRQYFMREKHE